MKFFIDTANVEDIRKANDMGVICGVTTNPSLILAFIEKNFMETIGIFVAVFLATTVGFYFERDAAKKFNLLTALSEEQPVKVRRNGKVMEIPRHDVANVERNGKVEIVSPEDVKIGETIVIRPGEKGQSNLEIARTPRKAFRCRVGWSP